MREMGKTKIIDGDEYTVGQLPATQSLMVLGDLAKMIAPALGAASEDLGSLMDSDSSSSTVASIVQMLTNNLDNDKIQKIVLLFAKNTLINKKPADNIDFHFQGRLMTMLKWIRFCLEVNYEDFLPAITALSLDQKAVVA